MNRGDIVLVDLPTPAGDPGHEQSGHRPALLIHSNAISNNLPVLMIIPFTSKLTAQRYPYSLLINQPLETDLLFHPCL